MKIREQFEKVLQKYGHQVILLKIDKRFRCECYSERSGGQFYSSCPKCFGTTFKVAPYKTKVRRTLGSVPESLFGLRKPFDQGVLEPKVYIYYMSVESHPKEGDVILECEWHKNLPIKIKEKFVISVSEPKYGENGQTEFYQVYVRFDYKGEQDDKILSEY